MSLQVFLTGVSAIFPLLEWFLCSRENKTGVVARLLAEDCLCRCCVAFLCDVARGWPLQRRILLCVSFPLINVYPIDALGVLRWCGSELGSVCSLYRCERRRAHLNDFLVEASYPEIKPFCRLSFCSTSAALPSTGSAHLDGTPHASTNPRAVGSSSFRLCLCLLLVIPHSSFCSYFLGRVPA